MGKKNRHSKDKLYITATEWSVEYGGKKTVSTAGTRPLPFDHCALSLSPYETPVCTTDGVIFDLVNLMPYIRKHKCSPITGERLTSNDIIRLNMHKNAEGKWHCPVTCKVFTNNSHIVAIKTTGSVFSYDAVYELNIKPKNFVDLLTNESFTKSDIITLQDPQDEVHTARRDISNFLHLKKVRDEHNDSIKADSKIRSNPVSDKVMRELEERKITDAEMRREKRKLEMVSIDEEYVEDVADLLSLGALTCDVNPGQANTSGRAASGLTSTSMPRDSSSDVRAATAEELREARWKTMRKLDKKGYAQLQTSHGNINLELHCNWSQRTCWNFIQLCKRGYYDNCLFHRLVPGFMVQTGDPSGTGAGGESAWDGLAFKDEFDSRLMHVTRGVLSMANSGANSNQSQFFITFGATPHLDYKHTIFGQLVGGSSTLDRIEAVGADKKEHPLMEIRLLKAVVFTDPFEEADAILRSDILRNIKIRRDNEIKTALPSSSLPSSGALLNNIVPAPSSISKPVTTTEAQQHSSSKPTTVVVSSASNHKSTMSQLDVSAAIPVDKNDIAAFLRSQGQKELVQPQEQQITSAHKKPKLSGFGDFSGW